MALLLGLKSRQFDIGSAFCEELDPRESYFWVDGKIATSEYQFYGSIDGPEHTMGWDPKNK